MYMAQSRPALKVTLVLLAAGIVTAVALMAVALHGAFTFATTSTSSEIRQLVTMGDLNRAARLATDQGNIAVVAGDALRVTGPNAGCYTAAGRTPAACTTAP